MKSIEDLLKSKNIIPERPPSMDEKGRRLDIFPAKVKGWFRRRRDIVYTLLLILFLIVPWTNFAGKQTILLNLSDKEFTFFGLTLLAHDGPLLFIFFGIIVVSLLFATALYGRVWCGWACPQTVFIDGLFRRIEEIIEGNHIKRKKLAQSFWSKEKIIKKFVKWFVFIIISSHIAHSILAYFIGAKELFWITLSPPNGSISLFIFVQIFTALIAINFGWFKEQFCLVACPYGRFQSVLMDNKSKTVIYDYKRGEPRRESKDKPYSDCVNCFKCVAVCPTGIDIRNGQQLECIACTACIDACDSVMEKLNKPLGLIRYASEEEIETEKKSSKNLNVRALIYGTILTLFLLALAFFVFSRDELSVKVLRATGSPYNIIQTSKGKVFSNHFKIHLTNQTNKEIKIKSFLIDDQNVEVVSPTLPTELSNNEQKWIHVFLKVPAEKVFESSKRVNWILKIENLNKEIKGDLSILTPEIKK